MPNLQLRSLQYLQTLELLSFAPLCPRPLDFFFRRRPIKRKRLDGPSLAALAAPTKPTPGGQTNTGRNQGVSHAANQAPSCGRPYVTRCYVGECPAFVVSTCVAALARGHHRDKSIEVSCAGHTRAWRVLHEVRCVLRPRQRRVVAKVGVTSTCTSTVQVQVLVVS